MKTILLILITSSTLLSNELIAKDSNGIIIEIKEKYGMLKIDTCNIVMLHKNFFVINKRGCTAWYPCVNHSIRIVERKGE